MKYDVIVIGNGPAGISSAIYAKRSNQNVLVISKYGSSLLKAKDIENYYGFEDVISGEELYNKGIKQAKNLGIDVIEDEVVGLSFFNEYEISTPSNTYNSLALIVATGLGRNAPNIKGIKEYEGKGVSYCAVCDGFFYRKKDVVVIGNQDYALHEANELRHIANKVTILTNGLEPTFDDSIEVNKKKIKEIIGEDKVEKVVFEDGSELETSGVFIAVGVATSVDFARKIGAEVQNNKIVVNDLMQTNLPGLFACGDNTKGMLQIAKAVYEGSVAGTEAAKYVRSLKK